MSVRDETDTAGIYVSFESFPGLELALQSLDVQRSGEQPELVAVKDATAGTATVQIATVYIPYGKRDYFLKRLNDYVETSSQNKAKNASLVEGIAAIRHATIRELWTDPDSEFPSDADTVVWWEVWLRRHDGREQERLGAFAERNQLLTSGHYLGFQDRTVMLVRATAEQLAQGLSSLDDLAELRRPHDVASLLTDIPPAEQAEWVEELRRRLQTAGPDSPVVCVLDTGIHDGHPLLADSLSEADMHVVDAGWQKRPVNPHGTEMAGLALYGDLHQAVTTSHPVRLDHRLESVKILPDHGQNYRDLYGAITARAVDRPEIEAPGRARIFMLAVTAPNAEADPPQATGDAKRGRPTSWSAAVDALTFGRAVDDTDSKLTYLDRDEPRTPRLFIVSAGNIRTINPADNHLDRSDLSPVEDPAQSWNSLTVGAYSRHDDMAEAPTAFAGYVPIAAQGELSPVSRTSVLHGGDWPFKPEVVADGGNVAASPDKTTADTPPNLGVLPRDVRNGSRPVGVT
ncbi:S8 family peptidase [Branchiibius hedensis]|uniref:S8 family peptidase n=1 Tax=Branchiibius hedensis TaxID=672460 RepID=UPI001B886B2F|nr:S8 family peptidase [Branchiibius hedensis]